MSYTIDAVCEKVAKAEEFLGEMCKDGTGVVAFRRHFTAFVEAAGSVPTMLKDLDEVPDNAEWFQRHMNQLAGTKIWTFFTALRKDGIGGTAPAVIEQSSEVQAATYHFVGRAADGKVEPICDMPDVVTAAREYFLGVLLFVYDCYVEYGPSVDPQQYFTKECLGDIEQAEIRVHGWKCQSLIDEGYDEDARWSELRSHVGQCEINHLFYSYLGRPTPQPVEPEEYEDFAFTPEDKGWTHVPAGFGSVRDYVNYVRERQLIDYPERDDLD